MSIYKRGKIYWYEFTLHGRRHRGTTRTSNRAQALKHEAAIRQQHTLPDSTHCLEDLYQVWIAAKLEKKSLKDDKQRYTKIRKFFQPRTPIAAITPEQVDQFKIHLFRSLSKATVNRHLALLKSMFNLAKKRRLIDFNPCSSVEMMTEQPRQRVCSEDEFHLLIERAPQDLRIIILLGYRTGMRLGEICSLRGSQMRLEGANPHLLISDAKNGSARVIPLSADLAHHLKLHPLGKLRVARVSQRFCELTKKLELEDLRFHDLRRSFVSQCRLANIPLATTQRLTGHKTASVLLKHYSVVADDELREAVERLKEVRIP